MGIARPLKTYKLQTVGASSPIEPASINIGKGAFRQGSTAAFLRSADDWLWEGKPTRKKQRLLFSGFSPAQRRLFSARYRRFEARRQEVWEGLLWVKKHFSDWRDVIPKARRLVEQNPSINPDEIEDEIVGLIVKRILLARLWFLDESPAFDD